MFITNKKAWQQHCEKKIEKSKKLREIAQLAAPKDKESVAPRATEMPIRSKSESATTTNSLNASNNNSPPSLHLIATNDSIGLLKLDSTAIQQKKSKKDKKEKKVKSNRTDDDTNEKKRKRSDSIEISVVGEKTKRKKEKLDRS